MGIEQSQLGVLAVQRLATRTFVATSKESATDVDAESDYFVGVDATDVEAAIAHLPDAKRVGGRTFKIAKTDPSKSTVTVDCVRDQSINGARSKVLTGIGVVTVTSDGANYYADGEVTPPR
jgi:hypothetical protein